MDTIRVLISGSKLYHGYCGIDEIPMEVQDMLLSLIKKEDDLIIGDSIGVEEVVRNYLCRAGYKNVTIYHSSWKRYSNNNIAKWPEKSFPRNGAAHTAYSMCIERDFHMVQDSDTGVIIWDGESMEEYVKMLCLVFMGKEVKLFLLPEGKTEIITELSELKKYVGNPEAWSEDDVGYVLKECKLSDVDLNRIVPEKYMSGFGLADFILETQIPLEKKEKLLLYLMRKRNLLYDLYRYATDCVEENTVWKNFKKGIRDLVDWSESDSVWTYLWEAREAVKKDIFEKYESEESPYEWEFYNLE